MKMEIIGNMFSNSLNHLSIKYLFHIYHVLVPVLSDRDPGKQTVLSIAKTNVLMKKIENQQINRQTNKAQNNIYIKD